ncbi:MAG: glycine cleavage system protein GcvH [Terrimicrobiaceae bacterium]|nr:glycine cleavage system protein GcvH [Terrimicrobiaceae bacterium]
MNIPDNLKYTSSHEWVRAEEGIATVGITDHAQAELTDIVYAEPPKPGAVLKAGDTAAVVESVKAASDIYAPLSGEILEVNQAVAANPSLLNSDPYGEGWLFKIRISDDSELGGLMSAEAYRASLAR